MLKGVDYPGITVVFLCHDGQGNYLLNKRSKKCRDEQGKWDPGGGSLDLGSTVEETLKREIKEEYCAEVLGYEFLGYKDLHRENDGVKTHWLALYFKALVDRKTVKNGEPEKFDEVQWFRLGSLPKPLHSQLPDALERFKDKL